MSLINKMLQDLEQRSDSAKGQPLAGEVRAVPVAAASRSAMLVGALLLVMVALGIGWFLMRPKAPAPSIPALAMAPVAAPAPIATAKPFAAPAEQAATKPQPVTPPKATPPAQAPARAKPEVNANATAMPAQAVVKKPSKVVADPAPMASKEAASFAVSVPTAETNGQKRFSPQQQSDNLYKQAIAQLQQGKGNEATKGLRLALKASPENIKARQALVDLLLEENNVEEATTLLREGLKLAPEQSGFSMTLARLQLDASDSPAAMATLEQGLKAAGDEPQYNAFYAVLLQRAQRHEDAVRHYLVALRSDPMMPTWLVGIGISLQAQGNNASAAEAFQRALDGGQLTPQLSQFVEQRLSQLK